MSGLEQLLEAVDSAQALGEEAVLATVVKVEGSAYRRPGARMREGFNREAPNDARDAPRVN